MRPWPEVLQKMFPVDPVRSAVLHRPWWRVYTATHTTLPESGYGTRYDRPQDPRFTVCIYPDVTSSYVTLKGPTKDLEPIFGKMFSGFHTVPDFASIQDDRFDGPARLAYVDTHWPLPHPGLRVGQIWALVFCDNTVSVFQITDYAQGDPKPWFVGSAWMPEDELRDLLSDAFLISDAACPHLAPWSSTDSIDGR